MDLDEQVMGSRASPNHLGRVEKNSGPASTRCFPCVAMPDENRICLPKQRRSIRLGTQICRRSDRRARSELILGPSCRRPRNSTSYTSIGRRCRQPSLSRQKYRGQPRADRSAKRSDAIRGSFCQKLSVTPLVFRLSRFDAVSRLRCLK